MKFILLLSGACLLFLSWPPIGFVPLNFIAFVPVFKVFLDGKNQDKKVIMQFLYFIIFFAAWIFSSAIWFQQTSFTLYSLTSLGLSLLFSLLMLPFYIYNKYAKISLVKRLLFFGSNWLVIEYFFQKDWLGSPYFLLGSGMGQLPWMIQHYEWIGVEGGSLWVLLVNMFVYILVQDWLGSKQIDYKKIIGYSLVFWFPLLISFLMFLFPVKSDKLIRVSALQSNFKSYDINYRFYPDRVADSLWEICKPKISSKTDLLVWPETVISNLGWTSQLMTDSLFKNNQDELKKLNGLTICFGANVFSLPTDSTDPYVNIAPDNGLHYLSGNAAVSYRFSARTQIRSKEFFSPFQEQIPLLRQLPFIKNYISILGNPDLYSYLENTQEIHVSGKGTHYLPLLCYESLFTLPVSKKAKDADVLVLLANEYWNAGQMLSKQYFSYHAALAIQNRISLVKSSNNGIAALFDPYGKCVAKANGEHTGVLTANLPVRLYDTVYSTIGGVFYLTAGIFCGVLLLGLFFTKSDRQ